MCRPNQTKSWSTIPKTQLGWVITRQVTNFGDFKQFSCNSSWAETLENSTEKFWKIEGSSSITDNKRDETMHFQATLSRNDVLLFGFLSRNSLFNSYHSIFKRFSSQERKLQCSSCLHKNYCDFMQKYEELRHMRKVNSNDDGQNSYYMIHHAVVKECSVTTKSRVVFDSFAKSNTGVSLNDA